MRTLRVAFCVAVVCVGLSWRPAHGENFLVGLSNVDITPMTEQYQLQGHNTDRLAQPGKYDDPNNPAYGGAGALGLSVRAIFIARADGSLPFVLVSVDVAHLCYADTDAVRDPTNYADALSQKSIQPLTPQRIIVGATHTHTAPASCDSSVKVLNPPWETTAQVGSAWRTGLVNNMQAAVRQAIANAELSTLRFRRNKSDNLAYCRRGPAVQTDFTDETGVFLNDLRPYTDANAWDHTLDVVEVTTVNGARRSGVVFFWGGHPDGLGAGVFPDNNYHYHPDFPGFARSVVERDRPNDNTIAIFVQAAGGDVNAWTTGQGYATTLQTGEALGARVKAVLAGNAPTANVYDEPIASNASDAAFDQLFPLSLQTAAGASRIAGTPGEPRPLDSPAPAAGASATGDWLRWATLYCNSLYGQGGGNPKCSDSPKPGLPASLDTELQSISIGNWRIAALSHEVMGLWGVELRQNWPQQHVSVVGYANRINDYLTTADMVNADDAYAADSSHTVMDIRTHAFDAFYAQFLYGNPAPWATFKLTNGQFDMETELHDRLRNARRTNFALSANGGVADRSSEYTAYAGHWYPVNGVNDGDRRGVKWGFGGGWCSNFTDFQSPEWASVRFSAPQTIREIDVFTLQDAFDGPAEPTKTMTCALYCVTDYDVQYKDASSGSWITIPNVGHVTANANVWRQFVFSPISTQEIRVLAYSGRVSAARIVEIEAWDYPERTNIARASGVVVTPLNGSADSEFTAQGWTFNPQSVVNGNRRGDNWLHDGGWRSHTTDFSSPEILAIALGPHTLDEIDVFTVQDGSYPCGSLKDPSLTDWFNAYPCVGYGAGITDFDVLVREPLTQQWTTVKSVNGNGRVWTRVVFPPMSADAVRIVVRNGLLSAARIVQVETWGW